MTLHLEIVTPTALHVNTDVDEVTIPGALGELGVLTGHLPLLTLLKIGELRFKSGGEETTLAINQGYAEVFRDSVSIVTDTCETAGQIDVERAVAAKKRAEEKLQQLKSTDPEYLRHKNALDRAITRIKVVRKAEHGRH